MIYNFNTEKIPKLSEVGGKAKALMETSKKGFLVPEVIVLSVDFFESCLVEIKKTDEWKNMLKDTRKETCELVQEKALSMRFNQSQKKKLEIELKNLPGNIYAVRSSSPEEDLENISFAGMYETYLGLKKDEIEKAIFKAFASAFSYRVMSCQ